MTRWGLDLWIDVVRTLASMYGVGACVASQCLGHTWADRVQVYIPRDCLSALPSRARRSRVHPRSTASFQSSRRDYVWSDRRARRTSGDCGAVRSRWRAQGRASCWICRARPNPLDAAAFALAVQARVAARCRCEQHVPGARGPRAPSLARDLTRLLLSKPKACGRRRPRSRESC